MESFSRLDTGSVTTSDVNLDVGKMTASGCKSGDAEGGAGFDGGRSASRDLDVSSLTSGIVKIIIIWKKSVSRCQR